MTRCLYLVLEEVGDLTGGTSGLVSFGRTLPMAFLINGRLRNGG